jgi:2'-5' RNA ligase
VVATVEPTYSRLFFALWPDDVARERIAVLAEECHHRYGGRRVATPSLHITLAFLGNTLDSRVPALQALAREIDAAAFDLMLAFAGTWHRGIFWLAPQETPAELTHLVVQLQQQLRAAAVPFANQSFAPHLTIMRNAKYADGLMPIEPIELKVEDFVLVRTVFVSGGSRHDVLERFPLRRSS